MTDAMFDGAVSRMRPVLMAAITSALGLIPMLLSNGVGAEIQKPLASVIVGGLFTATLLTLLFFRCSIYSFRKQAGRFLLTGVSLLPLGLAYDSAHK